MASKESMYQLYNPHVRGIWGWDLFFAERALREAREALEHGVGFKSEHAERALDHCLAEAERIRALLAKKEAA